MIDGRAVRKLQIMSKIGNLNQTLLASLPMLAMLPLDLKLVNFGDDSTVRVSYLPTRPTR